MTTDSTIAVMVSGGIDSLVALRYAHTFGYTGVTPVFVDYQQPYFHKERLALRKLDILPLIFKADLCDNRINNFPTPENYTIHGRNLLLSLYGGLIADKVWLASLVPEMASYSTVLKDMHPEFFSMMSAMMTFLMKPVRNSTIVETPFGEVTKTDVVKLGKQLGITDDEFRTASSCYDGEGDLQCGICPTCFKRWVALTNNGISEEYQCQRTSSKEPYQSSYGKYVIPRIALERTAAVGTPRYEYLVKAESEIVNALKIVGAYSQ